MKRVIQFGVSLFVVVFLCMLYSFNTKKATAPTSTVTYYLTDNTCFQFIPPNTGGQEDCRLNSLNTGYTLSPVFWSTSPNTAVYGNGNYLASITFNDYEYTLSGALYDVGIYYHYFGSLPADGQDMVFGTKHITIRRSVSAF